MWLMCAGVPRTVGSATRREKDQAGRGSRALALKNERPGTPFPDLLYRPLHGEVQQGPQMQQDPRGQGGGGALRPSIPAIGD